MTGTSGALVARVKAGEIEAAFVAEPFPLRDLEMQHVFTEQLVLITHSSVRSLRDIRQLDGSVMIGFGAGCSYRRRLDDWLSTGGCVPSRVMEFGSYHAIVAIVAAGTGAALVPRSVIQLLGAESEIAQHPLPRRIAQARTQLVWRAGHRSLALDGLRRLLPRPRAASSRRAA